LSDLYYGGVIILDFGSQYTQLIARRIREQNVYSKIVSPSFSLEKILDYKPKAIIFSGGPSSVYSENAPKFDDRILNQKTPILGICYGLHLLVQSSGGSVESSEQGEYGFTEVNVKISETIFKDLPSSLKVWMSHGDKVIKTPPGWNVLAYSSNNVIAALSNSINTRFATQFHPEVYHTNMGNLILRNFLFNICGCISNWNSKNFLEKKIKEIKYQVKDKNVFVGVSGGVDSSVVAALVHKAVGIQTKAIMIDHGLMRKNEAKQCVEELKAGLGININLYNEKKYFLKKLEGVIDPEEKRKIIGNQFIYSFQRISKSFGEVPFLAQGTLYPDVIESGISFGKEAALIKSHHNVAGLPDDMDFKLIEPLRDLFKDEVRNLAKELKIPDNLIGRHPFPGPGLGVRIIGEITSERIKILQEADKIFIDVLYEDGLYDKIWQAFAVLIPVKTVGVMGDQRTYDNLLGIRAVSSTDGMTADWYRIPEDSLNKISNRIVNHVKGINRIVYDITSKPPGTIEWE